MNVSEYIFDFFAKKGIDTAFMVTGGQAMYLNDAVGKDERYRIICTHHEQSAAMSADAYARMKNKPAVCVVTAGPGAINALNGVVGGYTDSSPFVVVSGQAAYRFVEYQHQTGIRQYGIQGINIRPMAEPVTKYFVTVDDPQKIDCYLERAYHDMTTGRPGPVWIDVPLDMQSKEVHMGSLAVWAAPAFKEDSRLLENTVESTIRRIKAAKRPLFIVGQGVKLSGAKELFHRLIDAVKIPVATSRLGIDLMESHHELYVGRPGNYGERSANFAVQNADLLIVVGSRLSSATVGHDAKEFGSRAYKIVIDIDRKELDKPGVAIDLKANVDAKAYFSELLRRKDELKEARFDLWIETCRVWRSGYPVVLARYEREKPVNSYCFIQKLSHLASSDAAVLVDTGSCFHVACQAWEIKRGQQFLTTGGISSMGYWAASIGACAANDYRSILCITGDGSLQMNIQELATIKHNRLPVKIFIFNNNGYLLIRQTQKNFMESRFVGEGPGSGVWCPDALEIARAYGIEGMRIDSIEGIEEKIRTALYADGPLICDVLTPEWQLLIPRVASEKLADGSLRSRPFEDMYPFLPAEELRANMVDE